jgi:uncharacterized protein (DUF362 family)
MKGLRLPRTVLEADFLVSLPKIKVHHWAGVTLSMKNIFGVVPGARYGWPKNILHWKVTMDIYRQAVTSEKRKAQSRVVELIAPRPRPEAGNAHHLS